MIFQYALFLIKLTCIKPFVFQGNQMRGPNPGMGGPGGMNNMNSNGPRGPFPPQMGGPGVQRFPQMGPGGPGNQGGMRPPFFNNNNNNDGGGDSDFRRGMDEPKEWPPDDDVNAEDEMDEDERMMNDSDDRMLPPHARGQNMNGPPGLNMRGPGPMGGPFGPRGPPGGPGGPMNTLIPGIARPQTPGGIQAMMSLARMMPPQQQQAILAMAGAGGAQLGIGLGGVGGVRLPMSPVGLRPGLMSTGGPPHLLAQSPRGPLPVAVSMNGSMLGPRPGLPISSAAPSSIGSDLQQSGSDRPPSREDDDSPLNRLQDGSPSPMPLMSIGGSRPPPGAPILGRGFAPMTIRPRGGAGLLGMRPGSQGGTFRFGSAPNRPMLRGGPGFNGGERPPFGNRFGAPFRPPLGFMEDDKDERRMLPRLDVDERSDDIDERSANNDEDERQKSKDEDLRKDSDDREKSSQRAGRPSRWSNADDKTDVSDEKGPAPLLPTPDDKATAPLLPTPDEKGPVPLLPTPDVPQPEPVLPQNDSGSTADAPVSEPTPVSSSSLPASENQSDKVFPSLYSPENSPAISAVDNLVQPTTDTAVSKAESISVAPTSDSIAQSLVADPSSAIASAAIDMFDETAASDNLKVSNGNDGSISSETPVTNIDNTGEVGEVVDGDKPEGEVDN